MRLHNTFLIFFLSISLAVTLNAQQPPAAAGTTPSEKPAEADRTVPPASLEHSVVPSALDPKEIVRRSVETDHRTLEIARNYTSQRRELIKHLGKDGEVKWTEIKTYDINFYYGVRYERLIAVDDKPLAEAEQKKEEEKLDKFLAKYRDESESAREKRLEKERKQREEGRLFLQDVVNAYDFRLAGEEKVDGADSYIIEATPRADFHPTQPHADMLKKIKGKLWIEKKDYNWVRVDAEAMDTISFGLFLFRIHPGSRFTFLKTLVNDEVWLLKRLDIDGGARIALFKNENVSQEEVISNFRKFVTTVKILPDSKEVQEPKQ
jgi:hypothetical protein